MADFNRRDLFRLGLAGLASSSLSFSPLRAMSAAASFDTGFGKLLLVFLRGAMDGVPVVIPAGDSTYPAMRQKTIAPGVVSSAYVDPAVGLPLNGSTYAVLNPAMAALALPDGNGDVAWMHQVGNPEGLRSHFTEQQIVETADPQPEDQLNDEGWVARLAAVPGFAPGSKLPGCSASGLIQRAFDSPDPNKKLLHISDLAGLGSALPQALKDHLRSYVPVTPAEELVHASGVQLLGAQSEILAATPAFAHDGVKFPINGTEAAAAGLPYNGAGFDFMKHFEEALYLLRFTTCRVAGAELGAFDTHQNEILQLDGLLPYLAHACRSAYDLTVSDPTPLTTLTMTEFGRTAMVNGNNGTDHGVGGLACAVGPNVNGGVYNCFASGGSGLGSPWIELGSLPPIGSSSPFANACMVQTHFLALFQEIIEDIFGITDPATQQLVLPGLAGASGPTLQPLDFLT